MKSKIRKLVTMPPRELCSRVGEKGRQLRERRRWRAAAADSQGGTSPAPPCGEWLSERPFFPSGYDRASRLGRMRNVLDVDAWIGEADQILAGRLTLLGEVVTAGADGRWDWNRDPVSGAPWPMDFYADVKKADDHAPADVKYVWELNRHQFLIVLGKAYWATGEERYARGVVDVIDDWIARNPVYTGVNWTSSLELAMRCFSWLWALHLIRGAPAASSEALSTVAGSLRQHARFMADHLSHFSSPYNHLIGEAAALYLAGTCLPESGETRRWESLGWKILEDQVEEQFHPDGLCVEQATFYHHYTLGFYLQAALLRRMGGRAVPEEMLARLEKALEVMLHVTRPDGTLPMIGDIDSARSVYFSGCHSWDFRAFLGIGAAVFGRSDFKGRSGGLSEEMLWLLSDGDLHVFEGLPSRDPEVACIPLEESGYGVFRSGWEADAHHAVFDCGEIAAGVHSSAVASAAHGHADALAFDLSAFGTPFLVDGGFHTYFGPLEWHKYFRQEEAHNTVRIQGLRQAEYCGRLTWKHATRARLEHWQQDQRVVQAIGSVEFPSGTVHRRAFAWVDERFWVVMDTFVALPPDAAVELFLHFDPEVEVSRERAGRGLLGTKTGHGLSVLCLAAEHIDLARGGEKPDQGWVAAGYGLRRPAWRARVSLGPGTQRNWTVLVPWTGSPPEIVCSESVVDGLGGGDAALAVQIGGGEWLVSAATAGPLAVTCQA